MCERLSNPLYCGGAGRLCGAQSWALVLAVRPQPPARGPSAATVNDLMAHSHELIESMTLENMRHNGCGRSMSSAR
jgi:hypothetical protein